MDTCSSNLVNLDLLFWEQKFLTADISDSFVGAQPNLAALGVLVCSRSEGILVNFGPLFLGAHIFDNRYLAHFFSEVGEI